LRNGKQTERKKGGKNKTPGGEGKTKRKKRKSKQPNGHTKIKLEIYQRGLFTVFQGKREGKKKETKARGKHRKNSMGNGEKALHAGTKEVSPKKENKKGEEILRKRKSKKKK